MSVLTNYPSLGNGDPYTYVWSFEMDHILMQLGGAIGALVGFIHGYLGEKMFSRAAIEPPYAKHMARLGWQCGAVAWVAVGVLLIAAAGFESTEARRSVIVTSSVIYLTGAAGNIVVSKGKHFGWVILTVAAGLTLTGW